MIVKTVILRLDRDPQQIEWVELVTPDALQINQSDSKKDCEIEIITIGKENPGEIQKDGLRRIRRASIYQRREADESLKRAIGPESPDDDHKNSCLVLIKTIGESGGLTFQNGVELLRGRAFTPDETYTSRNWLVRISPAGRLNLTLEGEQGRLRVFSVYWDEGDLEVAILEDVPGNDEWKLG